ncbi:energy coupling factor transporter S component ThiW [Mobilisporobacter senegalensis]|uniref:Energy coupling factor transporter S component ThiW n=1 Tax=Mobilisporobacter senegalensis TaxID=1329262 RepID=A0A3N1XT06_9FIRM|nr:energy coupling factor transporter S component ThiW [Mobilisporobacter senegalensis]ROR29378.1 energy coupling factor transporter S component ThiW [Mobilisporobacter senegalensis]
MSRVRKLSLAGILIAVGVICSTFFIPIGVAKVFPIQHFINVLAGVILGPVYGVCMAFITSLIRVISGTGSLLAFPGSMCGALLSGILFKYSKSVIMAFLGEVVGTGMIGAVIAYPIATVFLNKTVAFYGFILPFGISTLAGAGFSLVLIVTLRKMGILNKLLLEGDQYEL